MTKPRRFCKYCGQFKVEKYFLLVDSRCLKCKQNAQDRIDLELEVERTAKKESMVIHHSDPIIVASQSLVAKRKARQDYLDAVALYEELEL